MKRFGRKWAWPLGQNYVWPLLGITADSQGRLVVPDVGITIDEPNKAAITLLRCRAQAAVLHKRMGATFDLQKGEIGIEFDGIKLVAGNEADIGIVSEIFGECLYDFAIPGPFYVLDIGANIGLAALYFAKYFDAVVESFELVPSTAAVARRNLDLNPSLASRVTLNEFGLADADRSLELAVDPTNRPSNSLYDPLVGQTPTTETVQVRDVATIFEAALGRLDGRRLVVKLDAEGAEYEIVQRLIEKDLLRRIDYLILEWHERKGKDPSYFRSVLKDAGFHWNERKHPEAPVGYICAFRG